MSSRKHILHSDRASAPPLAKMGEDNLYAPSLVGQFPGRQKFDGLDKTGATLSILSFFPEASRHQAMAAITENVAYLKLLQNHKDHASALGQLSEIEDRLDYLRHIALNEAVELSQAGKLKFPHSEENGATFAETVLKRIEAKESHIPHR